MSAAKTPSAASSVLLKKFANLAFLTGHSNNKTIDSYRVREGLDEIWSNKYKREGKLKPMPTSSMQTESTKTIKPKLYLPIFKENIAAKKIYDAIPRGSSGLYDDLSISFEKEYDKKIDSIDKNSRIDITKDPSIKLTTGRYNLAKVHPNIINSLVSAAKRQKVNPNLMIALAGRESTFDINRSAVSGGNLAGHKAKYSNLNIPSSMRSNDMQGLVSGWTVQNPYLPKSPASFLADRRVPGIKTEKTNHGVRSYIEDEESVNRYLKENPHVMSQYRTAMKKTKNVKLLNSFDMAAQKISKEGLSSYNPGDKEYVNKVKADYQELKRDPAMNNYLRKINVNPAIGFRTGGLFY